MTLVERLDPVDALGLLGPEAVRVVDRARVHLLVLGVVDIGALLPLGRNVVNLVRHRPSSTRARLGPVRRALCSIGGHYATAAGRATRLAPVDFGRRVRRIRATAALCRRRRQSIRRVAMSNRFTARAACVAVSCSSPARPAAQSPPPDALTAARELIVPMRAADQFKAILPVGHAAISSRRSCKAGREVERALRRPSCRSCWRP